MTNFNSPDSSKNSPNVTEWEVAQSLPCVCGNKDTEWSSTEADETYCPKCGKQSICGQWPQAMHQPDELCGVYQRGATDCVRACVATLFSLPLDAVATFSADGWADELKAWLQPMGFAIINMSFGESKPSGLPVGYTLGAVASDSLPSPYKHCVVCLDGETTWCPTYGEKFALKPVEEYTVIYPLRPCVPKRESRTLNAQEKLEAARVLFEANVEQAAPTHPRLGIWPAHWDELGEDT